MRRYALTATVLAGVLALAACGSDTAAEDAAPSAASTGTTDGGQATEGSEPAATSVTVEDNFGSQTVELPLTSVVATDNRTFETLHAWGVQLSAASVALMPGTIGYVDDTSIIDLGNHREPDLEALVAVEPQLIINGQRFVTFREDMIKLAPDATIVELEPREGEPFDAELKRQTTVLGEIFGKQAEAEQLNADLDAAIARVAAAYNGTDTVMAVNTSGGNIGYVAPKVGRTLGPLFDIFGLTPALEVEGSNDHQGDDISVEAIADSNPDWILVMDRDAAVAADDPAYKPANELLETSDALANVTAVKEGRIVYMPADTYTNEGIQTYTEFFNAFADALEAAR